MKDRHRICFRRMFRRLEQWMAENGKTWEEVQHRLEDNGMQPQSAERKLRRLRKLECKPCSCLLMDIFIMLKVPPELIIS